MAPAATPEAVKRCTNQALKCWDETTLPAASPDSGFSLEILSRHNILHFHNILATLERYIEAIPDWSPLL
jgi:hypothetical protein